MITKEKFIAFVKVQTKGSTNMLDYRYVCADANITKDEHLDIIKNYAKYETLYNVHVSDYENMEE